MCRCAAAAEGVNDERGFLEIKTSRREIKRPAVCSVASRIQMEPSSLSRGLRGGRRAKTGAALQEFLISLCRSLDIFLFFSLGKPNIYFFIPSLPCGHSDVCLSFSLFLIYVFPLVLCFSSRHYQANQEIWPRRPTLSTGTFLKVNCLY